MSRKKIPRAPFLAILAFVLLSTGCVRKYGDGKPLPAWLADNLAFVQSGIEGTVFIDATMPHEEKHHGGIGTMLDKRHALLPAHSVKGASSVIIYPRAFFATIPGYLVGEKSWSGKVVAIDLSNDAALFETDADLDVPILKVDKARRPVAGEHVWYFGKVHGFQPAKVSAPTAAVGPSASAGPMDDVIVVDMEAADGDSGAPLVTDDGYVVGVLYGTSTEGKPTYFVPIGKALAAVGWR